jgi:hypothetical protein
MGDCGGQSLLFEAWLRPGNWEIIRQRLLRRRICDMKLRIRGSSLEPLVGQLQRELSAKRVNFVPSFYLTDSWGCPDKVPVIGIPFYLSCTLLSRIEKEQTGNLEDTRTTMQLLRHEAGHAVNYAFRLWEEPDWREVFGSFYKPYREVFHPNPWSRRFVRHICSFSYGYTYAQKHPDDDFAETFAVWLTPRSGWRRKYRNWPAIQKLKYVDRLMRKIRDQKPRCKSGKLLLPVSDLTMTLREYYAERNRQYGKTS